MKDIKYLTASNPNDSFVILGNEDEICILSLSKRELIAQFDFGLEISSSIVSDGKGENLFLFSWDGGIDRFNVVSKEKVWSNTKSKKSSDMSYINRLQKLGVTLQSGRFALIDPDSGDISNIDKKYQNVFHHPQLDLEVMFDGLNKELILINKTFSKTIAWPSFDILCHTFSSEFGLFGSPQGDLLFIRLSNGEVIGSFKDDRIFNFLTIHYVKEDNKFYGVSSDFNDEYLSVLVEISPDGRQHEPIATFEPAKYSDFVNINGSQYLVTMNGDLINAATGEFVEKDIFNKILN